MSNEPKAGKSIDPEMLAAYIDNRLPPEQRAAVEAQLANDPESYALLVDTLEALDDDEIKALEVKEPARQPIPFAPKPSKSGARTLVVAGSVLAAAATLALAVWTQPGVMRWLRGEPSTDPEIVKLVAALGPERSVAGRLSGGFPHAILRERRRSIETDNLALLAAAAELQRSAQQEPSPPHRRAYGVALLQLGRYDEAVTELSAALSAEPSNAGFQNDLAVAFLERARHEARSDDWSSALAAADRAIAADPGLTEAWFNRALALDGLRMRNEAVAAWQEYLARDSQSAWSEEARKALSRLGTVSSLWERQLERVTAKTAPIQSLVDASIQGAREHLERVLLVEWANQQRSGDGLAALQTLTKARALAERLAAAGGDGLALEELTVIEASPPSRRDLLANAYLSFKSANDQLDAFDFVSGTRALQQAVNELQSAGSPMAMRATVFLASAHRVLRDTATAKKILVPMAIPAANCSAASAERERVLGLAEFSDGDYGAALGHYSKSLDQYRACQEHANVAALHALSAEILSALGLFEQAWSHQWEALGAFEDVRDTRIRMQVMFCAGRLALQQGLPEAALYFHRAFVAVAEQAGNMPAYAEARANVAKVLLQLGRRDDARQEIADARLALQAAHDPAHQRFVTGELAVAIAFDGDSAAESIGDFDAAILHARTANRPEILPSLFLLRSRHHQRLDQVLDARSDLRQGIDAFGAQLGASSGTWSRWSFRASGWMLYQELAELELSRGDGAEKALEILYEGNRAVFGASRKWHTFREFQTGLPAGAGVLFTTANQELISVWLVTRQRVSYHSTSISRKAFDGVVSRFAKAAASSSTEAETLARQLHDVFITPFDDVISGLDSLAVVSSESIGQLPWAGLKSRAGQFLVERLALRVAETELNFGAPLRVVSQTPIAMLAASAGSSQLATERLRLVKDEVRQISGLYPNALTLDGETVSAATAIGALRTHGVFHFAGHATANQDNPDLSALLLRQNQEEVVTLTARTLSHERVSPDLVVLTACRTAVDQTPRGAGRASLASVLLRAGSRAVVATLGDVPDDVAHSVGIRLHQRLVAGDHLDQALRNAQLEAVGQSDFWPRTLFATFY